jgi:DinB family protein
MTLSPQILSTLEATPTHLAALLQQVPEGALRWEPESWDGIPGERLCFADQISHVRDIEVDGYQVRIRRMQEEDVPDLASLDAYAMARERNYVDKNPFETLNQFRDARIVTLHSLRKLTSGQLERRATFGEYGEITLEGLVRFLCSHDQQHLSCLNWLLGKLTSR